MVQSKKSSDYVIYTYDEIREDQKKFDEIYSFVKGFGGHAISHLSLQPKMLYFLVPGIGFVSFMKKSKHSRKAYVLGDPFCHSDSLGVLMDVFFKVYPHSCFLQVSYDFASFLSLKYGFYANVFGTETFIENEHTQTRVSEKSELEKLQKELVKHEKQKDKLYEKMESGPDKKMFWKVKKKIQKLRKKVSGLESIVSEKENKFFIDKHLSKNQMRFLRREYSVGKKNNLSMIEVTSYEEINFDVLEEISESWLFDKVSKEEMSFLLRPLEKAHLLKNDRRLFLLSTGETVQGFIEVVPMYKKGSIFGYYADIIRIRSDAPSGSVNFFLLEVMNLFFSEGYTLFSLGLSPFHKAGKVYAGSGRNRKRIDNSFVTFTFKNTFEYGNFLYNSKGQAFHKEKFRSRMERTYYCTRKWLPVFEILGGFTVSGISFKNQIFGKK